MSDAARFDADFSGRMWASAGRTITTADVFSFAGVSGDFGELHVNEAYAASTPYGRTIAHGLLTLIVTTTLASAGRPFPARASYGYDGIRFVAPVFPGDTLTVRVTVGTYRPRPDGHGVVDVRYEASNQHGHAVMVATHHLLVHPDDVFSGGSAR